MVKRTIKLLNSFLVLVLLMNFFTTIAYAYDKYYSNQDVTGYFDDLRIDGDDDGSGYDKAASGVEYRLGIVATKPNASGGPTLAYGSTIWIDENASGKLGDPIPTPAGPLTVFDVQDLSAPKPTKTEGYFDVYCGRYYDYGSQFSNDAALESWIWSNIGETKRSYKYYYPQ